MAGLLFWSSLASMLPTLPPYIASVGADKQGVGLVMGSFAIGLLVVRQPLAQLADARGRKMVLLIGMTAAALAPLGYIVTGSLPALIGIRALHGISIAAFAVAYSVLVVDLSPPQVRGEVIGSMSLVNPLGLALGPAMGGFLQARFGYAIAFSMSASLGLIGLLCISQVQDSHNPLGSELETQPQDTTQFWQLLTTGRIRIPALVLLMVGIAFGALSTFVPLYAQEIKISLNVGLFYTAAAIASFSMRLVAGPASDRLGRGLFITLSLAIFTLAMGLLSQVTTAPLFLAAGFLEGAGLGILIPMTAALMADRSESHERGRTFGVCMVGFDAGIAVAGPVLGTIGDQIGGYRGIFTLAAILAWGGLLLFVTQSSKTVGHSWRFAIGLGRDGYAIGPDHRPAHLQDR